MSITVCFVCTSQTYQTDHCIFWKTAFMTWYPVDSGYDSKKEKKDEHYVYSALHNLGEISAWFLKKI